MIRALATAPLRAIRRAGNWLLEKWDAADEELAMRGADPTWRRGDPHV